MYFIKTFSLLLSFFILIDGFVEDFECRDNCIQDIKTKTVELQKEVQRAFESFNRNCKATVNNDQEFEKVVNDFLKTNFTLQTEIERNDRHPTKQNIEADDKHENFITKFKNKISSLLHRNKTESHPETRLKRCLLTDLESLDLNSEDEIRIEKETLNLTLPDVEDLRIFLLGFISCLRNEELGTLNSTQTENFSTTKGSIDYNDEKTTMKSSSPLKDDSRFSTFVRYLTQMKHPVQDVGKPIHKSPDLKKVQSIVDQIKNVDFFNLDKEETSTAKCEEFDEPISPTIDDVEMVKRQNRRSPRRTDRAGKKKRTSSSLFNTINMVPNIPNHKELHESENHIQEPQVVLPNENERLLGDLDTFQSKLNPEQQLDISNFLDHIRDKPKTFKFDTSPFLLAQLEKLKRPLTDGQDSTTQDEDILGERKFFEFNSSPVKRSLNSNQLDDYQKIAKLKSKLVAEYRDHHPMIDYSAILRRIDADKNQKAEKSDEFFDRYYRLNDGSSKLDDMIKSHRSDEHVISPYELNLNLLLNNQFKELDSSDFDRQVKSADVPLQKPEFYEGDEAVNDILP